MKGFAHALVAFLALTSSVGCDSKGSGEPAGSPASSSPSSGTTVAATSAPKPLAPLASYEGSAIARDLASQLLVVADEDHGCLRVV
ncbi:MAG: hypothetical protein KC731_09745, partial [Myxococcales bacterium]|nr:hypothetical protein [Myxococcales bacterium]